MSLTVRTSGISIPNGTTYRLAAQRCRGESHLGVSIRSDRSLSVSVAYGRGSATAADEGGAASLPYAVAAQTFAANDANEGGTHKNFALPAMAEQYQLCLTNSSGATATVTQVDEALQGNVTEESC